MGRFRRSSSGRLAGSASDDSEAPIGGPGGLLLEENALPPRPLIDERIACTLALSSSDQHAAARGRCHSLEEYLTAILYNLRRNVHLCLRAATSAAQLEAASLQGADFGPPNKEGPSLEVRKALTFQRPSSRGRSDRGAPTPGQYGRKIRC